MIRIRSKRHLFRRCGIAHPTEPVDYSDDRFTSGQLAVLKADHMLLVEEIAEQAADDTESTPVLEPGGETVAAETPASLPLEKLTVAELKARCEARGIEPPKNARKTELIQLLEG